MTRPHAWEKREADARASGLGLYDYWACPNCGAESGLSDPTDSDNFQSRFAFVPEAGSYGLEREVDNDDCDAAKIQVVAITQLSLAN